MSAQINLYHPRFLKQHDPLTLRNTALAATAVYVALAAAGGWAWQNASARRGEAAAAEEQLKAVRAKVEAATKELAARKPSPQLAAELERSEATLLRRTEIARQLEGGAIGNTAGFSDFMRGFARQAQDGLWLTGFKIGSGGEDMEVRGSMLNAASLPDYIRRLGGEKAFQGRNFAALTLNRPEPAAPAGSGGRDAAAAPAAPGSHPIEFVLLPNRQGGTQEGRQ